MRLVARPYVFTCFHATATRLIRGAVNRIHRAGVISAQLFICAGKLTAFLNRVSGFNPSRRPA